VASASASEVAAAGKPSSTAMNDARTLFMSQARPTAAADTGLKGRDLHNHVCKLWMESNVRMQLVMAVSEAERKRRRYV
jgi:cytochrome c5